MNTETLVAWMSLSILCTLWPLFWFLWKEFRRDMMRLKAQQERIQKEIADTKRYVDDEVLR